LRAFEQRKLYCRKDQNMDDFIPVNEPLLTGNEKQYIQECIDTAWISSEGPFVRRFEQLFAQRIGRKFGVAVSSGTAALDVAVAALEIGPGDEVFIVGRFINHEGKQGKQRNLPSLRFGNIAMMPWEPIKHPDGHLQESFLVEVRSIGGYSGSPVFVHILPFSKRPGQKGWSMERGPWLLGIDWGHLPLRKKVEEWMLDDWKPISDGWTVEVISGMTGVVPVWRLEELLNIKELASSRKVADERLAEELKDAAVLDSASDFTKEQFGKDLKKVSRKIKK